MDIDRRRLIAVSALTGAVPAATWATPAAAAPLPSFGVDATTLGVRAGGGAEQSQHAASRHRPDRGRPRSADAWTRRYRVGELKLPSGAQIIGVRGATRLVFTGGDCADCGARRRPCHAGRSRARRRRQRRCRTTARWFTSRNAAKLRIVDCEILNSSRNGIPLEAVEGTSRARPSRRSADVAIFSRDAAASPFRATSCAAPATVASWCIAPRKATTARWSSTTASRISRNAAAARASTATPSTCSAPAT